MRSLWPPLTWCRYYHWTRCPPSPPSPLPLNLMSLHPPPHLTRWGRYFDYTQFPVPFILSPHPPDVFNPPPLIHLISSLLPPLTWWGRYSYWTRCPLSHSSSPPRPHWHWQRACVWPDRTARWRGAASDWPQGHRTAACYHLPWCWSSLLTDQNRGGAWGPAIGTKELQKVFSCTKQKCLMENKRHYDSWHGNLLLASVLEGQPLARSCWWTTCSDSCHSYSYMLVYTHCRPRSKFCKK